MTTLTAKPPNKPPAPPSIDSFDEGHVTRALQAFVRAEFQAPVAAIAGFIDLLMEDAARGGHETYLDDLGRMQAAGARLGEIVTEFLEGRFHSAEEDEPGSETSRRSLRHDLRTPITTIVGYGELVAEDAREHGHRELLEPLADVFDAARRLLADIERLAAYAEAAQSDTRGGPVRSNEPDILQRAVEVVRHLAAETPNVGPDHVGRILVVDDNPSILELVARRLEREGHAVVTAAGGEEALRIVKKDQLDLMLLDLMMPGMNGLEVLRRLRENSATSRLPVIVISALDEMEVAVRCIEAGADDYLSKPLDPTLLRARIGSSLERKFLRDREQEALQRLRSEQDRSDRLLRNILPDVIVERLRDGETVIADHFDEATILFCDLVGFTTLTTQLTPAETLAFLNDIFSGFDRLASRYELEKIKTIGDAYMVVGGLPRPKAGHARALASMALDMRGVVAEVSGRRNLPLDVRIGIDHGPAVAGIIGERKFFYDVWGDSVNTASRLEGAAEPGEIWMTAAMRDALGDAFTCESRGLVEIRGKGAMEIYALTG